MVHSSFAVAGVPWRSGIGRRMLETRLVARAVRWERQRMARCHATHHVLLGRGGAEAVGGAGTTEERSLR
jgi:hypothetical protein